jgi:hypothetical protein
MYATGFLFCLPMTKQYDFVSLKAGERALRVKVLKSSTGYKPSMQRQSNTLSFAKSTKAGNIYYNYINFEDCRHYVHN